jgi:AraC family L-rhamnose operon transcriptional activator RhaR
MTLNDGTSQHECHRSEASKANLDIVTAKDVFASSGVPVTVADLVLAEPARAHVHEFLELAFVTAGQAVHTSEAGTTLLRRGQVVLIAAGGWHAYRPDLELHVVSVRVGPGVLRTALPWVGTLPGIGYLFDMKRSSGRPSTLVAEIPPDARRTLRPAIRALTDPPEATYSDLFSRLARLFDLLAGLDDLWCDQSQQGHSTVLPSYGDRKPGAVETATGLLRAKITEPWSLGRLAGEVHLSRSQIVRLFGVSVGLSPMAYLRELRAQRMAELLQWSDLSVANAARAVGWSDPNYASRCFRSRWGMSPSEYRHRVRVPMAS